MKKIEETLSGLETDLDSIQRTIASLIEIVHALVVLADRLEISAPSEEDKKQFQDIIAKSRKALEKIVGEGEKVEEI